jgi:hypothetical protein
VIGRWDLLQILLRNLKLDRNRILMNKRALEITQRASKMVVKCSDGSHFTGDMVIGADGIHSIIRKVIYRQVNESPNAFTKIMSSKLYTLLSTHSFLAAILFKNITTKTLPLITRVYSVPLTPLLGYLRVRCIGHTVKGSRLSPTSATMGVYIGCSRSKTSSFNIIRTH